MFKILDCTLRDGGYYTNWDFDKSLVHTYLSSLNNLPVDYIEVGYRSIPIKEYYGKYFYSPVYELQELKSLTNKKLVIIFNEKDIRVEHVADLLEPIIGIVDMVRIALDPQQLGRALKLAAEIKRFGFEVGFNVMYMSKWKQYGNFVEELSGLDGLADYFYMVDSYGGVFPDDVKQTMDLIRSKTDCKIGFHGHNNLELALINSLTAIDYGADIVDSTILGMGRGAGNLKTELLLSVLNTKYNMDIDFNAIGNVVEGFDKLLKKYEWGTNVPYMISGSNSLPQKDVMDWYTTRVYSLNSMVRALQNQKNNIKDNAQLPVFKPAKAYSKVLILGGGSNSVEHSKAIIEFINQTENIAVVHSSSKNASYYKDVKADQFYCLVGNEGHRLEKVFSDLGDFKGTCVFPPFPRKMGTYIPAQIHDSCFEFEQISFTDKFKESHSILALQTALELKAEEIYIAGFDGYQEASISQLERSLVEENEFLFQTFQETYAKDILSLTPTRYKTLLSGSVYSLVC
ncbi:aldolase catalytic domain-containing protein [Pedobacter sp. UYP1]|uniref:aldolase catalytic domain-containing protein n=1 Tax=Pedobacter sp. UYP1 TaxID=1756396 RepID=UPI003397FBED